MIFCWHNQVPSWKYLHYIYEYKRVSVTNSLNNISFSITRSICLKICQGSLHCMMQIYSRSIVQHVFITIDISLMTFFREASSISFGRGATDTIFYVLGTKTTKLRSLERTFFISSNDYCFSFGSHPRSAITFRRISRIGH